MSPLRSSSSFGGQACQQSGRVGQPGRAQEKTPQSSLSAHRATLKQPCLGAWLHLTWEETWQNQGALPGAELRAGRWQSRPLCTAFLGLPAAQCRLQCRRQQLAIRACHLGRRAWLLSRPGHSSVFCWVRMHVLAASAGPSLMAMRLLLVPAESSQHGVEHRCRFCQYRQSQARMESNVAA